MLGEWFGVGTYHDLKFVIKELRRTSYSLVLANICGRG